MLCAFDWVGIGSRAHVEYRKLLAEAAECDAPERVTVHAASHDAPAADYSTEDLIKTVGLSGFMFDPVFARKAIKDVAAAVKFIGNCQACDSIGLGSGRWRRWRRIVAFSVATDG